MDTFPKLLLQELEILSETQRSLEKQKQDIFQKLTSYKKQLEKKNSYLIGKRAMCIHIDNPIPVECICTAVIASDDYETVKPLFSKQGKKYIIESYDWIK
jgi:beta-lactamase regulating signal transducer with metallopeptidase domain